MSSDGFRGPSPGRGPVARGWQRAPGAGRGRGSRGRRRGVGTQRNQQSGKPGRGNLRGVRRQRSGPNRHQRRYRRLRWRRRGGGGGHPPRRRWLGPPSPFLSGEGSSPRTGGGGDGALGSTAEVVGGRRVGDAAPLGRIYHPPQLCAGRRILFNWLLLRFSRFPSR